MYKQYEKIIIGISLAWSIANITEVVSMILLILSLVNILWNMAYGIYCKFKQGKLDEISDEISKATDEIENIINKEENKNAKDI